MLDDNLVQPFWSCHPRSLGNCQKWAGWERALPKAGKHWCESRRLRSGTEPRTHDGTVTVSSWRTRLWFASICVPSAVPGTQQAPNEHFTTMQSLWGLWGRTGSLRSPHTPLRSAPPCWTKGDQGDTWGKPIKKILFRQYFTHVLSTDVSISISIF